METVGSKKPIKWCIKNGNNSFKGREKVIIIQNTMNVIHVRKLVRILHKLNLYHTFSHKLLGIKLFTEYFEVV